MDPFMHRPMVIGIGGGTGSGKTAVSDMIRRKYAAGGVTVLNQDSYYVDRSQVSAEERRTLNYDHPSSIDHDLLLRHLEQLLSGLSIKCPCYCFATHTRTNRFDLLQPAPIILVEGIFALWDTRLRAHMDIKIYMEGDSDLRFIRRLRRDVRERGRTLESVIEQYLDTVRPMHKAFIDSTKAQATMVIENSGSMESLETIVAEIVPAAFRYQQSCEAKDDQLLSNKVFTADPDTRSIPSIPA